MLELFTATLCPFAMRARMAVAEKNLQAELIEINLRAKPQWFLELSPNGEVPLLRDGSHLVWGAATIAEYLEEIAPEPPLMPSAAHQRSAMRAWVNFADMSLYAKTATLLHSSDQEVHARLARQLEDDLRHIMKHVFSKPDRDGPYWLGARFTLADIAFFPWFDQLCVLEQLRGLRLPPECQPLLAWRDTVAARNASSTIANPPEFYLQRYGALQAGLRGQPANAVA